MSAEMNPPSPQQTNELLQRILNAVEPAKPRHRFEIACASVLFFGGIARAFDSRRLRVVLAALAVLLFLGTLVALTTMPICHE